jgi:hypothetical protein
MTVRDLIAQLEGFPPELPVILGVRLDDPTAGRVEGDADAVYTSWALLPGDVLVVEGQQ